MSDVDEVGLSLRALCKAARDTKDSGAALRYAQAVLALAQAVSLAQSQAQSESGSLERVVQYPEAKFELGQRVWALARLSPNESREWERGMILAVTRKVNEEPTYRVKLDNGHLYLVDERYLADTVEGEQA